MVKCRRMHICFFKVGVVGAVVKMVVGVDDIADGPVGQRLQIFSDIARAIAGVDGNTLPVARHQVGKIAGGEHLPGIGGDQLRLKERLIHMRIGTVRIADQDIMLAGKVNHFSPPLDTSGPESSLPLPPIFPPLRASRAHSAPPRCCFHKNGHRAYTSALR